jgi:hypothetical protein
MTMSLGRNLRCEPGSIVIFDKGAQQRRIGALRLDRVDHIVEAAHTATCGLEGFQKRIISALIRSAAMDRFICLCDLHRVIQHPVQDLLVGTSVRWISIKYLPDTVDACGVIESRPEIALDVLHSVNS